MDSKHIIKDIKQIVFLSGAIDMNAVVNAAPDSKESLFSLNDSPQDTPRDPFDSIENEKLRYLLYVINGREPPGTPDNSPLPHGIIEGKGYVRAKDKKVLVFAKEAETIENIRDVLAKHATPYIVLAGKHNEIQAKINEFRQSTTVNVMLIESERHASGINLQFATDLVFYHKLSDDAIARQAVGRIQRCGRTCSGNVWYLQYDAEKPRD
jgi:SNF2 family DNA or RNA helicase